MRFLLDTNIILFAVRQAPIWDSIKTTFHLDEPDNYSFIALATFAEIKSLARQFSWGAKKIATLDALIEKIPIIYPNKAIANHYVEIDLYSKGKHHQLNLPSGQSSIKMGKNDLWIVSSAIEIGAALISSDKDFSHLNDIFLTVHTIVPGSFS